MGMINKRIGCFLLTRTYMYITCLLIMLCSRELNAVAIPPKTLLQSPYQVIDRYLCTSKAHLLTLKSTICKNMLAEDKKTNTDSSILHEKFKQVFKFHHCEKLDVLKNYTSSNWTQNVTTWCHISNELLVTLEPKGNQKIALSLIKSRDNLKSDSKNDFRPFHGHIEMDQYTYETPNGTNTTIPPPSIPTTIASATGAQEGLPLYAIIIICVVVILVISTTVICCVRRRNNMNNTTLFGARTSGETNNAFDMNEENNYDNNRIINNQFEPNSFILENNKVFSFKSNSQQNINNNGVNKMPMMPPTPNISTKMDLPNSKKTGVGNQEFEEKDYSKNKQNEETCSELNGHLNEESDYDNFDTTNNTQFVPTPFVQEKKRVALTKSNSQQNIHNNGAIKLPMMPPTPNISTKMGLPNSKKTGVGNQEFEEKNYSKNKQNDVTYSELNGHLNEESDYDNFDKINNTQFAPTPFVPEKKRVALTKSNSQQNVNNNGANNMPMMPPTTKKQTEGTYSELNSEEFVKNSFYSPVKLNNHLNEEGDYDNFIKTNNTQFVPTPFVQEKKRVALTKSNSQQNINNNGANKVPLMPPTPNIRTKVGANAKKTGVCNEEFKRNENMNDKQNIANEGIYSELNLQAEQKDDVYEGISVQTKGLFTTDNDYRIPDIDTEAKNNTPEDYYVMMTNNNIGSENNDHNTTDQEGNYMSMGNDSEIVTGSNQDNSIYEVGYVIPDINEIESEIEGHYVPMTENNNMTSNCNDENIYSNNMTSNCDENIYSNGMTSNYSSCLDENIYDDTISPDRIYSNAYEPTELIDESINNAAGGNDDYYVVPAIHESIEPFTHVEKSSGVQSSSYSSEYDHGYMVSPITERKTFAE